MQIHSQPPAHEVVAIEPTASARAAARRMSTACVGTILVVEEGELLGLATDRDIALHVLAGELDPDRVQVAECMTAPVVTVPAGATSEQVARRLREAQVRRVVLVDEQGRPVAVAALDDVVLELGRSWEALAQVVSGGRRREEPCASSVFGEE